MRHDSVLDGYISTREALAAKLSTLDSHIVAWTAQREQALNAAECDPVAACSKVAELSALIDAADSVRSRLLTRLSDAKAQATARQRWQQTPTGRAALAPH